jgi:lipopolysaccharide assembly outer membrane protein LptD (OstA)
MKTVLLVTCCAVLCLGQESSPAGSPRVARGWWDVDAAQQTSEGYIYHLRGHAGMRNKDIVFHADQIDYDEDKAVVHLAGHVTIETNAVALGADDVDYNIKTGEIQARRGDVKLKLKQVP